MTRPAAFVTLLALGGCATVAQLPRAAEVVPPARFAYAPAIAATESDLAALLPTDPAYPKLRALALNAPDLAAAAARVTQAQAQVRASNAARLPSVEGSTSVTRARNARTLQPGNPFFVQDATTQQFGTTSTWDVDLFGRLRADARAARARLDAATADAAGVRLALDRAVAVALISVREAQQREAIVRRDLADARDLAQLTNVRVRAGITPSFDLVRAESLVSDAEARLAPVAGDLAAAVGQLVTLTGQDAATVQVALFGTAVTTALPAAPAVVPSVVVRNRPDVAAAAARLNAADADLAAAAAARFPRLSLTGALGLVALATGDLFGGDALAASLGVGVSGPLLDFGRVGAQIDSRRGAGEEAFALYRGTVFRALGETEAALAALSAARARASALAAQEAVDADALALARERYRLGLTDFLTVIDAQRTLNVTRQAAATARAATQTAAVTLYAAAGGAPG